MATIDPSIPLSVQPMHLPSPAEMIALKDLVTRGQMNQLALAAERRRQQADQALRAVYADPASRDDKGGLTPAALGKIEAIDPATGMQVRSQMALAAQREAQTKAALARLEDSHLGALMKKNDMLHSGGTAALNAYDEAVRKGVPEPEARSQAQGIYSEQLEELRKSGVFSEDELRGFPTSFDPQKVKAGLASMLKAKDYFSGEEQRRKDAAKAPTTRTRVEGTREVQEEWDPKTQAWKQVGAGPRFKPSEAGEPSKAPAGYRWKDGKVGGELEPIPGGPAANKTKPTTIAEKMNPVMRATVELDIKEMEWGLEQLDALKSKTAGAFFDDHVAGNALVRFAKKKMTPDEMQEFEVYANRFSQAIASVQSMGRGQISDAKVAEARKLIPVPGDSEKTIQAKQKALRRVVEQAREVLTTKLNPSDRGAADDVSDMVDFWEK